MNTVLLHPTDVLFFRDGRPMSGASSGHGAAWPLPTVVNAAFHAALHRAGSTFETAHKHRRGRNGLLQDKRDRRFGSLVTVGPFPVHGEGAGQTWYFPRPLDAADDGGVLLFPGIQPGTSSGPKPCCYPVLSSKPPSKLSPRPWWSESKWNAYLGSTQRPGTSSKSDAIQDSDIADSEHTYGIGLSTSTGTVESGRFYSASYLRLRHDFSLGLFAEAKDKVDGQDGKVDLIDHLLNNDPQRILIGGQQRVCTAEGFKISGRMPLPLGRLKDFNRAKSQTNTRFLVKWILLTPAIWPHIPAGTSQLGQLIHEHHGGWLPNWICPKSGDVLLKLRTGNSKRDYSGPRVRRVADLESAIRARLVAAVVSKPIPVTGWALADAETGRPEAGAKSTLLAVPAGAVYYFEADSEEEAISLATALNWHGDQTAPTTLRNRRSTLLGEKGFGIGVCGTWQFHDVSGHPTL